MLTGVMQHALIIAFVPQRFCLPSNYILSQLVELKKLLGQNRLQLGTYRTMRDII